MPTKVVISV